MSNAWEVTNEDVRTALSINGVSSATFFDEDEFDEFVDECMGELDFAVIENEALRGNDMDEQTEYALEAIQEQLQIAGRI